MLFNWARRIDFVFVDGSTAVLLLIHQDMGIVATLGDSSGYLAMLRDDTIHGTGIHLPVRMLPMSLSYGSCTPFRHPQALGD